MFKPVASLRGLYEINESGYLRDYYTKKPCYVHLNLQGTLTASVKINGRKTSLAVRKLLKETFGIEYRYSVCAEPCVVSKDSLQKFFPTLTAAAQFLYKNTKYKYETIYDKYLRYRKEYIDGWHISYGGI